MTITDLIARVESAPAEMEVSLLKEGLVALHPEPADRMVWDQWAEFSGRFYIKLDADAPIDAAMMLLKDGDWALSVVAGENTLATLPGHIDDAAHGYAKTPALALLAAQLKQEMNDG